MSRGRGSTQRRIVARLVEHCREHPPGRDVTGLGVRYESWLSLAELAGDDSKAARESARRAIGRLEDEGVVETLWLDRDRRRRLCARLKLDHPQWRFWWATYNYETADRPSWQLQAVRRPTG
jgi:hypothetical protein